MKFLKNRDLRDKNEGFSADSTTVVRRTDGILSIAFKISAAILIGLASIVMICGILCSFCLKCAENCSDFN